LRLKECDDEFNIRSKMKGKKLENFRHIQDATGTQLWLTGEPGAPVRLEITGDDQQGFDQGVQMSKELITAVFKEYQQWKNEQSGGQHPAKRLRM